nr:NUDIX domain-containing protein [Chloroflexota bacterium]
GLTYSASRTSAPGTTSPGDAMNTPLPIRRKVLAYITHGNRLLVFRHSHFPEAGIQVPAGTVGLDEDPDDAALREAVEETGLENLTLDQFLGEQTRDMSEYGRGEIHHRRFYHVRCVATPPDTWRHVERHPSDGAEPIAFDFFWVPLPRGVPPIAGDQDALLCRLLDTLGLPAVRA